MQPDQWPLVLWLQLGTITASILIARRVLRSRPVEGESADDRSARLLREIRWAGSVSILTWVGPFALWESAKRDSGGAGPELARWLFAIAWTSYVISVLAVAWLIAKRRRATHPATPEPRELLRASLAFSGWFTMGPLFAAWLAVAFSEWTPWTHSATDLTDALCLAAGSLLAGRVAGAFWTRVLRASAPVPESVAAELRAALGTQDVPPISVAPLVRSGLPQAVAVHHGGAPRILVDRWILESLDVDERTAILLHETGHLHLEHIRIRRHVHAMCYAVVLIGATAAGWGHLAVLTASICLVRHFVVLPMYRRQEMQADAFAARLGHAGGLSRALARLHDENDLPKDFGKARRDMSHPDLVRRQHALAAVLAEKTA